jgi:hypothetical protein
VGGVCVVLISKIANCISLSISKKDLSNHFIIYLASSIFKIQYMSLISSSHMSLAFSNVRLASSYFLPSIRRL